MAGAWLPQSLVDLPSVFQQVLPAVSTVSNEHPGDRPPHWANDSGTAFKNPWPESSRPPAWSELAWPVGWKKAIDHSKARSIKVQYPDFDREALKPGSVHATWLGHASVLLRIPLSSEKRSMNILADPIFSARAGPTQFTGPRRFLDPPCSIHDLPNIHAVVISHNHYDHLDYNTISQLKQLFPNIIYFVPLRVRQWFLDLGIPASSVRELDWWDCISMPTHSIDAPEESVDDQGTIRFTCVPAQHNAGRTGADSGAALWCGWVFEHFTAPETRSSCVYFAGDTGYRRFASSEEVCPIYKEIGDHFGSIDLSFLPIWRGGSLGFVSYAGLSIDLEAFFIASHSTPACAVGMHKDLRSKVSIPIHFATFVGCEDETLETTSELAHACEQAGVPTDLQDTNATNTFACLDIGQQVAIPCTSRTIM